MDRRSIGRLSSVPAYFALRVAAGLALLKLAASLLPVGGFAVLAQLMLLGALLGLAAVGGAQNGLIRQAAAAPDAEALARAQRATLLIWAVAVPVLALAMLPASGWIAALLTGTRDAWWAVAAIALLALASGPGQIWCSMLTGRGRAMGSLAAQALGLAASTALAAWWIGRGDATAAAVGFAAGPLVTMAAAALLARRLRLPAVPWRTAASEVPTLLRYSAAFAATTGFSAILLFVLRALYRDAFGDAALGHWVAANRISDLSTQFLGLFLVQFFVPHLAGMTHAGERRALVLRCWAAGAALMAAVLAVFSLAPAPLVRLFLSDAFLPAIPAIQAYMVGDLLRVWASLAMFAAYAAGRPGRYAAIEIGTLAGMAAITVALIGMGEARAPWLGYVGAYGVAALVVTLGFWRSGRVNH